MTGVTFQAPPDRLGLVEITGPGHPHHGEHGELTGMIKRFPWGTEMWEICLYDCRHKATFCMAKEVDFTRDVSRRGADNS